MNATLAALSIIAGVLMLAILWLHERINDLEAELLEVARRQHTVVIRRLYSAEAGDE